MKKIKWIWIPITSIVSITFILLVRFGWEWFPKDSFFDLPTFLVAASIILAFLGVWWSTNKQIKNQNKNIKEQIESQNANIAAQIESQNENVKEQIQNQIDLINKQIGNQNKESHRPYLTFIEILNRGSDIEEKEDGTIVRFRSIDFLNGYQIITNEEIDYILKDGVAPLENDKYDKFKIQVQAKLKNIGYGVATNIILMKIKKEVRMANCSSSTGDIFSTVDVGVNQEHTLTLNISSGFKKDSDDILETESVHLLLMYTDLHKSIYATMIIITIKKKKSISYTCYPNGTSHFDSMMKKLNGNYEEIVKKYTKINLQESVQRKI